MAIGALLGMVRDSAVQAAPETMRDQVREIIDGFTSKLGGKPVEGPSSARGRRKKRWPTGRAVASEKHTR